jgi:uncharacterized protein (UPF0548 family)
VDADPTGARPAWVRGPFRPGRVDEAGRREALAGSAAAEVTYGPTGVTLGDARLPGYRTDRYEAELGRGAGTFERARDGLRAWAAHRGAGVQVEPPGAPLAEGTTVVLVTRLGPASVLAACRVVAVVDEARRFGFAYGTLPLHPERGEESFVVERGDDAVVRFRVVAVSRPAHPLARLGAPVSRRVQRRVTNGYLEGLRRAAAQPP